MSCSLSANYTGTCLRYVQTSVGATANRIATADGKPFCSVDVAHQLMHVPVLSLAFDSTVVYHMAARAAFRGRALAAIVAGSGHCVGSCSRSFFHEFIDEICKDTKDAAGLHI